jgi:hypothetical protein
MNSRKYAVLATTIAVVVLAAAAMAQDNNGCSNQTLKGAYSFSIHGEALGIFVGTPPTLQRFPFPTIVDGVALMTFDGAGKFTAVDFIMRNGASIIGPTTAVTPGGFRAGETGTYVVNSDCTGTLVVHPPDGSEIPQKFVLANSGHEVRTVFTNQHVPQIPNNPACTPPTGCDLAVQIQANGVRVKGND